MINTEASGFGCKQSHKRAFNRRHAGSRDSGLLLNIWLTSANSSKEKLKAWLRFDIKERIHPSMNVIAGNRWRKSVAVLWLFCTNVDWMGCAMHCNELADTLHAGDTGSSSRSHQDHLLIISPGTSRFPPSGMGKVDGCTCCVLPDDHLIKKQNNRMIFWSKIRIISSNASLLDGRRPFPSLAKGIANHCHVRGDQVWERLKIV